MTALAACAVAVLACANQVNATFGAYPTIRYALGGIAHPDDIALPASRARTLVSTADRSLESQWKRPADLDSRGGKITTAVIPGSLSSFGARPAKIYLPPAYFAPLPPRLPVLILLTGQPGTPQDWLGAGRLSVVMDSFAAEHQGLAPVVVVPDPHGRPAGRPPVCGLTQGGEGRQLLGSGRAALDFGKTDSRATSFGLERGGRVLRRDLCATTGHQSSRRVSHIPRHSRILEPTLGDRNRTVAEAFGGVISRRSSESIR